MVPDDIIVSEIFPKLPVKSLLRFMCVCKSWKYLIESPEFIDAHRNNNNKNNNNNNSEYFLWMVPDNEYEKGAKCTMFRESHASPSSYVKDRSLVLRGGNIDIIGTCEGLICLKKDAICIWNPCIGSLKILSPSPQLLKKWDRIYYGFGFDRHSNDYRVINLMYHGGYLHKVKIYSLCSDSWSITDYSNVKLKTPEQMKKSIFFQGSLYWLGLRRSKDGRNPLFILRFDVENGIFEEIDGPPIKLAYLNHWNLVVENGFFVVLQVLSDDLSQSSSIGVGVLRWVLIMKNEWIKENFCFPVPAADKTLLLVKQELSESGHFVFESNEHKRLFIYDYNKAIINNPYKCSDMQHNLPSEKDRKLFYDTNAIVIENFLLPPEIFSWPIPLFVLVRERETLVLLNQKHEKPSPSTPIQLPGCYHIAFD